jgi:hypothetical protein
MTRQSACNFYDLEIGTDVNVTHSKNLYYSRYLRKNPTAHPS